MSKIFFSDAFGWEPCSASIACDTTRGLTCSNVTNTCECDEYSYWDNVTTFWCEPKVNQLVHFLIDIFFYFQENLCDYLSI